MLFRKHVYNGYLYWYDTFLNYWCANDAFIGHFKGRSKLKSYSQEDIRNKIDKLQRMVANP